MLMVATVLRSGFVGKDLTEGHVVPIDTIARRSTNDQVGRIAKIADQGRHSDVQDVVSKAPAIGPTARNEPAVFEWILNAALQHVPAKDTEPRIVGVVGIGWVAGTTTGEARFRRRQIDLDQIRNVDACDVRAIRFRSNGRIEHKQVYQVSQLWRFRILPEQLAVAGRTCAAVQILVCKRHQSLVEERISLTRNLNEWSADLRRLLVVQDSYRPATRRRIDTCDLLVAAKLRDGDFERH